MIGIKKTSSIKNKFFDNKPTTRLEEKIPQEVDFEMECEEEKDVDFEMKFEEETVTIQEMEIDSQTQNDSPDSLPMDEEKDLLEDVKNKRSERRKTILKELEVCDLLELRNPQCVSEYASSIYD
jgi:hypothetical protein